MEKELIEKVEGKVKGQYFGIKINLNDWQKIYLFYKVFYLIDLEGGC